MNAILPRSLLLLGILLRLGFVSSLTAQNTPPLPEATLAERGPHHATYRWSADQIWPDGRKTVEEHHVVQLASGLNYLKDSQWVPSSEIIEIFPDGAIARHAQHQVIFSANLNSEGVIDLLTPDGVRLRSHILGIAYLDSATGESVLLAQPKDSLGEVAGNVVIYKDAFDGPFRADARFRFTRGGFEQDVILHDSPPSPADFGMDPSTARLEVWTEFLAPPPPTIRSYTVRQESDPLIRQAKKFPDLIDQTLGFGAMEIGSGRAFLMDRNVEQDEPVRVVKSWVRTDGRQFLIEAIELNDLAPLLKRLGQAAAARPAGPILNGRPPKTRQMARLFPAAPGIKPKRPMQMASASVPGTALVLDYQTLNSSLTNYTFRSDITYRISGVVNLYGTNNLFEGGTVIKYDQNTNATIDVKGKLLTDTEGEVSHPVVLTASADDSLAEPLGGTLSGSYATTALRFDYATSSQAAYLQNVRIQYALVAVAFNGGSGHELRHVQLVNCGTAVQSDNAQYAMRNVLAWNSTNGLTGSSSTGVWEHATFDGVTNLVTSVSGYFTNSLFTAVVNTNGLNGSPNVVLPTTNGVYKPMIGGWHYLVDNSPYRDIGTTSINPTLAAELKQRTTYGPVSLTTVFSNTVLSPLVPRDLSQPDIGFHYGPVDYVACGLIIRSNVTLMITNGTALAFDHSTSWNGITLQNSRFISVGTPLAMNWIGRLHMSQELGSGNPVPTRAFFYDTAVPAGSRGCEFRLRYTVSALLVWDDNILSPGTTYGALEWSHCDLAKPGIVIDTSGNGTMIVGWTNNLFRTRTMVQAGTATGTGTGVTVYAFNNFSRKITWKFMNGSNSWVAQNNLFDTMDSITDSGSPVQNSYNAYYSSTYGLSGGYSNMSLGSLSFQTGPLSKYYQPTNSPLINAGSTNAGVLGFYHQTTATNEVKETNSVIDIGPHFVALDATGQPADADGDGLADYFEDRNGDGAFTLGETDWTTGDTDGDGVSDFIEWLLGRNPLVAGSTNDVNGVVNLRLYTPLK